MSPRSVVERLVMCESKADAKRIALEHPDELRSYEADHVIASMIQALRGTLKEESEASIKASQRLVRVREVLRSCRRYGIEKTFAALGKLETFNSPLRQQKSHKD